MEYQELYVKTTKKVGKHTGYKYDLPQDILVNIDSNKIIDPEKPTPPDTIDDPDAVTPISEEIICKNEINQCMSQK